MGKVNTAFDHIENQKDVQELSVVLYAGSFFYGFWDSNDILVKSGNEDIARLEFFLDDAVEKYSLKMMRLMSTLKPYTHLPDSEYDPDYFKDYFKGLYNLRKLKGKKPIADLFVTEEIRTLHFIDKVLAKRSKTFDFPYKNGHISTAMANYSFLIENDFISYISDNTLHISWSNNQKFRFYNQFNCYHKEDYLFFYLLAFHGLKLDPTEQAIALGGGIDEASILYKTLDSYLPKISLMEEALQIESVFPKHYYFDLYLCKSCV